MSLGKHSVANAAGTLLPLGVAVCTVPLFLRYVGPERYGILAVIWALLAYFSFFDFGFARAVVQRLSKHTEADDQTRSDILWTALCATFVLALAGSVLLWIVADAYLTRFADVSLESRREAIAAMPWLAIALPFVLIGSVLKGALAARLRFVQINVIEVVSSTLTQLLPLAAAASGFIELHVLLPAALVSRVVSAALLLKMSRTAVPLYGLPQLTPTHLRGLATYGGWMSVVSLLALMLVMSDRLAIGAVAGAAAVAFYIIPFDLVTKAMVITTSISSALFPRLTSDPAGARELAVRATKALLGIMTPVVVCGILTIETFLRFWINGDFAESSRAVPEMLLLGVWLNAVVAAQQSRLLGADNPRSIALLYLVEAPIYLIALFVGLHHWGLIGAAAAWTLRMLMDTVLLLCLARCFVSTLRAALPSLMIVAAALLLTFSTAAESPLRWALGLCLLALCVYRERGQIRLAMQMVRANRKFGSAERNA